MKIRLSKNNIRVRFNTVDKSDWLNLGKCSFQLTPIATFEFELNNDSENTVETNNEKTIIHLDKKSFETFLNNEVEGYSFQWNDIRFDLEKDYPCAHQAQRAPHTFIRPE
jgi:hypothetical protein